MSKLALGVLIVIGTFAACGGKDPVLIDANTADAGEICNILDQTGCMEGLKCAWLRDSQTLGHIDCVPEGAVALDGACGYGAPGPAGYSNCVHGTECVNSVCKSICDHNGGPPMCDTNHACSQYDGLFESASVTIAGVCDPKCDPLTQELSVGTTKAACGSVDPTKPDSGCYTFDVQSFTCAGVPDQVVEKRTATPPAPVTDRQPALTPNGFGSNPGYINGCEAGYVPFLRESTGSTVSVCVGLCAPAKTDVANTTKPAGDAAVLVKLANEAAPAAGNGICAALKKGSTGVTTQNCTFIWPFNNDGMKFLPGPYNDTLGFCRDFSKYNYDPDQGGPLAMRNWPSCQTLPSPKAPPANCTCDATNGCTGTGCPDGAADEWFCYGFTETFMMAPARAPKEGIPMPAKMKQHIMDERIGGGKAMLQRHKLRFD
jgi:hypothetical protein